MTSLVRRVLCEQHGQDLIEYALLTSSLSLVAIGAISQVGTGILNLWNDVAARMP